MYSIRNFAKYAVGTMLAYSVASTAIQSCSNHESKQPKEMTKPYRVDYGLVGDTLSLKPDGNAVLSLPDSVKVGLGDKFVRTGKNTFDHLKFNVGSVKSRVDELTGVIHDTIYFADKPEVNPIKGNLKAIKTVMLKAK